MAGYSGTPLWKKLGLRDGVPSAVIGAPGDYAALIAGGPEPDWGALREGVWFVHFFAVERAVLARGLAEALAVMDRDGMVWVSWPKKSAKVPTDITEDVVREVALPMGLVDVKVCAVDATWSGLKLVIRKALR